MLVLTFLGVAIRPFGLTSDVRAYKLLLRGRWFICDLIAELPRLETIADAIRLSRKDQQWGLVSVGL